MPSGTGKASLKTPSCVPRLGDVARVRREVEVGLVTDDVLIEIFHEGTPWAWCPVDG